MTPITDDTRRIIFQIEIDPRSQTKAFADIAKVSYFQDEDEILITLGALFRIERIVEDKKDEIWVAHVSLANEDDYRLKETFSYMKNTIGDDTDLDSLGKILIEMGEYDQAKKCYRRMLDEAKLVLSNAESGLGKAHLYSREDDESLEHLEEALQIRRRLLGQEHAVVGECYSYMGMVQWYLREDYDQALSNLKQAIEIQEKTLPSDSLVLAKTYSNIAATYCHMEKYDLALNYYDEALKIQEKVLPSDHPNIALTYNNLGWLYETTQHYSKALEYYQKSLKISQKTLPPAHPELVRTENNIRELKDKMKN